MAQHSWSSSLEFHPHWHIILSDGVFTGEGDFWTLFDWNTAAIQEDLRRSILAAFVRWSKLSLEVAETLADWEPERSGFPSLLGQSFRPKTGTAWPG